MIGKMNNKRVIVGFPHGMCAGVRRALDTVDAVLERFGVPVFVLHEIVHNSFIVNSLKNRGICFAESLNEVPPGSVLLFSAHGVSSQIETEAKRRKLQVIDVTCPLVKHLHCLAEKAQDVLILIGHCGHPEVEGTVGRSGAKQTFVVSSVAEAESLPDFPAASQIELLAQTTLDTEVVKLIEARLKQRYPGLKSAAKVCYATTNRQNAVRELSRQCDTVLVIGSPHSSNSNQLRVVAKQAGAKAFLIENADEIPPEILSHATTIGVEAGASAPEFIVWQVLEKLQKHGFIRGEDVRTSEEETVFPRPAIPSRS
jgi:4-hydroxy-3-methylbut-2-enyl diphosphate reductase